MTFWMYSWYKSLSFCVRKHCTAGPRERLRFYLNKCFIRSTIFLRHLFLLQFDPLQEPIDGLQGIKPIVSVEMVTKVF